MVLEPEMRIFAIYWYTEANVVPEKLICWYHLAYFFQKTIFLTFPGKIRLRYEEQHPLLYAYMTDFSRKIGNS